MVGSALLRRHIGRLFAALRQETGHTQEWAADKLDRSVITIQRIEAGSQCVRFRDFEVHAMCDLYQASPEDREALLGLTRETHNGKNKSWWLDYTETALPNWFGLYVSLEDSARTIRQYEPELIPGLLQTRAYAEEITSAPPGFIASEEAERRVTVRMARQALLTNPRPPHLSVILNEAVLCRQVGGPKVMAEQLRHLLELSRSLGVAIRVLPFAAGAHGGMASAFTILDFPYALRSSEPLEPPVVYVDSLTGALYLNKPSEVYAYELAWDHLGNGALDEDASRKRITEALEGFDNG
ncbi:helix-turn-helix domain-containing protein [Micromonospora sp. NPDC003197]